MTVLIRASTLFRLFALGSLASAFTLANTSSPVVRWIVVAGMGALGALQYCISVLGRRVEDLAREAELQAIISEEQRYGDD